MPRVVKIVLALVVLGAAAFAGVRTSGLESDRFPTATFALTEPGRHRGRDGGIGVLRRRR